MFSVFSVFNSKNPLKNIDVLFLWPGAEEWGNKGSKHFCETRYKKLVKKYDLNNSCNINIDMVGSYIGLLDKVGILRKKSMNKNRFLYLPSLSLRPGPFTDAPEGKRPQKVGRARVREPMVARLRTRFRM